MGGPGGQLLGRLGVIADVQYAEVEDAVVYGSYPGGSQARRFANSLQVLRRAVGAWGRAGALAAVLQLGDLLDGRNSADGARDGPTALAALATIQDVLAQAPCTTIVNVIGNHELYNFSRARLQEALGGSRGETAWQSLKPIQVLLGAWCRA